MVSITALSAALLFTLTVSAQEMDHGDHHDHDATHQHEHHDDHGGEDGATPSQGPVALSRTPEIEAALAAGGEAAVVEVLGVVCDFCAKAMNKTFGKRDEVAAVYVDLDAKTLNLVFVPGETLSDDEIADLAKKAGYRIKSVHRGGDATGGAQ